MKWKLIIVTIPLQKYSGYPRAGSPAMQALKSSLCHFAACLEQLVTITTGTEFHCHGTCYKGVFLPEEHASKDYASLGHSYRNLSHLTDHECFSACISDCRCLSLQTRDSSCELKWNPVNTDTKGTCHSVRIIRVSVLSGLSENTWGTYVLSI